MSQKLLSREEFKLQVFTRSHGICVCCDKPAVDAHHIMDRKLFPDNGFYIDNGAAVCEEHHWACERTDISVKEIVRLAGIKQVMLPPHLEVSQEYDKWGNPVLANGQRLKGEMFDQENVQKILREAGKLDLFTSLVKYPRTFHLPWSLGATEDDKMIKDVSRFEGQEVVVTVKMDGENSTLYRDSLHARSLDSLHHPSRSWLKQWASTFAHEIPEGMRICGENMFAKHSIAYDDLPSYFLGFSMWNQANQCLSWDETMEWFTLLGVTPVEVLYRGIYDEAKIKACWKESESERKEGYVMRLASAFPYGEFRNSVAKFVRPKHVTTGVHWRMQEVVPNKLKQTADILDLDNPGLKEPVKKKPGLGLI